MADYKIRLGVELDTGDIKAELDNIKTEPIKINIDLNHTKKQIDAIKTQIQGLNKVSVNLDTNSGSKSGTKNAVNDMNWAYKQMLDIQKKANSLSLKINGLDTSKNINELKELSLQFARLRSDYEVLKKTFGDQLSTAQFGNLQAEVDETNAKLAALDAKMADVRAELAKKIELKLETGEFSNQVKKIESDSKRLSGTYDEIEIGIKEVNQALFDMKTAAASGNIEDLIQANERYEKALKDVHNQLQINARAEKDLNDAESFKLDKEKALLKLKNLFSENSEAAKKFGSEVQRLEKELNECGDVSGLKKINKQISNLATEVKNANVQTQTFGEKLKAQFSRYKDYLSIASVFMYATQGLKDMFEQVVAIDSAMTELKKVTDETGTSYDKFLRNAATRAKEIGTTMDGLVSSTADFARLGYGFEDAQGLAEVANIYAVVGDEIGSVEDATQSLVSTLAAFKGEMNGMSDTDFAMSIVDKMNEVANNYAISSGGIGEALKRSASSMSAANNSLDETIALITAANTVVQDPDKVGNAFKTVSMRIRGAKTELEEAGLETDGMVESTAKLREEIMALSGVDIMLDKNTFKSTYQILDELSVKWEDLSDIAQASITELIAGKHQGNVISSLMSNFDIARKALNTSLSSSGSAMKEHAKWSDSLEAKLLKLKATWQSLSQSFLNSKFLKGAIDSVIGLVNAIDWLIDKVGTLPTLLTGFSAFKSFSGKGFFKVIEDEASASGKRIASIFGSSLSSVSKQLSNVGSAEFRNSLNLDMQSLSKYRAAVKSGMSETEAFGRYLGAASKSAQEYAKSGHLAAKGVTEFGKQQKAAQVTMIAQNKSLSSARAIMKEYNSGCKNTAMSQKDFVVAVSDGNSGLGKYLSGLNGAKATMGGYAKSLVGATIKTAALQVATSLLNAALTMGVSLIISGLISAITKWIHAEEELAEKVSEVTTKFREQHNELSKLKGNFDTSNEDSMISKYEKLSKGVDGLGRNISLTAEEYSEYQSIVDSISSQFPELITGYDEQGNALLSCKDNVELLTEAYEKLIHTQNREILTNTKDIEDNFKNALKNAESSGFWESILPFGKTGKEMNSDAVEILEKIYNKDVSGEEISKLVNSSTLAKTKIAEALKNAGVDMSWNAGALASSEVSEVLAEMVNTEPEKIKGIIEEYYAQFDEAIEQKKTIVQAKLSEAFDISSAISGLHYENIGEELQSIAYQTVGGLDLEFFKKLEEEGKTVEQWTTEMLDQLNSLKKEDSKSIGAAFDLRTQFNGGDISYGEYIDGLENTGKLIDGLDLKDEVKSQLKLSLGLDEKGLIKEFENLKNQLASDEYFNIMPSEYESFLRGLSSEELSVAVGVITELKNTDYKEDIEDIKAAIEREMMLQGLTFDLNLEVEAAGIESLNTALAESVSATGLSSESIAALRGRYADLEAQGYDLSSMFEETSHGIHLNRQELNKFESELSSQKLNEINSDLAEMQNAYDQLGEDIKKCTDPVEKAKLFSDRQLLAQRISEAATLASQYQGLTSAYNDWLAAEEAGSERGMYENVIQGFETVADEIKRGWYDDGTIKFLELLTGRTDLAGKSASDLKQIYKDLDKNIQHTTHSVRDFFTVDEDGNSTSQGVYNFLDAIGQMEEEKFGGKDVVKRDENNRIIGFDFQLVGGDEAIAEALGISEELVQIMLRAADDAGFVVSMDGTYKQLADLQNEAKAAANYLKEIGKTDFEFDFNTSSISNLKTQLEEAHKILYDKSFWNADGTFNFNADGATEAMKIVSTLQAKLDKLTEEQYGIGLTVEDEKFEEPLEKLQEYGRNIQTLNQLELNPKANSEEIEKLNGELDSIAEYFAGLDGELKVELGFEAGDGVEEVKSKIESGEVKIPTVLDIQANMDKNIERLADLAWLNSGLLSESEEEVIRKKYKVDVEVEADKVDTSDVDNKVDGALSGSGGSGRSGKFELSREANIKIIAETTGIEDVDGLSSKLKNLDDKTIQAIAEVFGQVDVDKLSAALAGVNPVHVEAIAEAIGKGDVDGLKESILNLHPRTVQAIAEAFGYDDVNDLIGAIDNLDPKTVQAIADVLGIKDVDSLRNSINKLKSKTVTTTAKTSGTSALQKLKNLWDSIKSKTVTIFTSTNSKRDFGGDDEDGSGGVNGTANVNGTAGRAFKQGSWGTNGSGTALVGELGREVLVRDGRYYTIGDYGAEFIKYKKGDIIFNHVQSEELFKNGRVTSGGGRAKSFVNGTAFAFGRAFSSGTGGGGEPEVSSKKAGSSNSNSDSEKEFEEIIDLIEIAIDRIERNIDTLDRNANSVFKSWSSRSSALIDEISEVGEEISLQQSAYDAYMKAASDVGLSSSWISKIQNGSMDVSTITDEDLADKIKKYQEFYEKALDCKDAIEELQEKELSLYQQRFDNVVTQYEGMLSVIEHEKNMLDEYISQSEAQAHLISENYYNALISNEKEMISKLQEEKSALLSELATQESGTEQWYANVAKIDEVTLAIEQSNTAILEWQQSIQQLKWEQFDLLQEKISAITEEADFLVELLSNDKLFDDNGKLTDEGSATMGLHGVNYNTYMHMADDARKEAERLKKELAKDPYDTELEARYREMIALQQEHILAAEGEKEAIRDLVEEGIETQLDSLQELIDKKNELLDSERDLYEYQKKVKEQTKEIAALEKQLSAYEGDDSEEAQAKIQQIKVDLEAARQDLEETETDRLIESTAALLDNLYLEYKEILNMRLDNIDALIDNVIAQINADASSINATLTQASADVGYNLSTEMSNIWSTNTGNITSVITMYGNNFSSAQTTTNAVLGNIKTDLSTMIGQLNSIANTKAKSAANSSAANSSSGNGKKPVTPKEEPKKETTKAETKEIKVGGKINAGNAPIYDYAGDTSGERQLFRDDPIYTVLSEKNGYILTRHHKLSSGYTGWFKKSDVKAYATGAKKIGSDDWAWTQEGNKQELIVRPSDGAILTPVAKGDSVLNANASRNIWNMANSPVEFIRDNLSLGSGNVPNNSTSQNIISQNFENVTFSLPNVHSYNELISEMQRDPKFEKLILAMTIDQIAGKSKLTKGKAIR